MPSLHPDPRESFSIGWPVLRDDGLDDLARFIAEPGFRRRFRLPGGQFALCRRDERTGMIAALRDPTATMPLHAHYDGRRWLVSTSIRRIEALVGRQFALRLDVLRTLHQTGRMATDASLYHEVELLAPGTVVLLGPGGSIQNHVVPVDWPTPAAVAALFRQDPEQLNRDALAMVRRSVTDAIDVARAIVQQSGGLDSNLILHTAVRAGLPIAAHGMVFPGLDCDESGPMRASCELAGVAYDPVVHDGRGYADWKQEMFRCSEYVPFATTFMLLHLGRRACDLGFEVMVNGMGGDEVFSGSNARSVSFLAHLLGPAAVRYARRGHSILLARGMLRRLLSGRQGSLAYWLVSGSWYYQMCAMQLMLDEGVALRMPFRDWRLIVALLPSLAASRLRQLTDGRQAQRELLDRLTPGLCARARLGKVHFNALIEHPDTTEDPRFGAARFSRFADLVPAFSRELCAAGRELR